MATKSTARCLSQEFLVRMDTIVLHICSEPLGSLMLLIW
jgi:hypothetical protein